MKKILLIALVALMPSFALAGDLGFPFKAPSAPERIYNWTGLYLGVDGGVGAGKTDYPFNIGTTPGSLGLTSGGQFGGGQVGANYQIGSIVVGVEADIQATNLKDRIDASLGNFSASGGSEVKYFGTARGRLGYAFDRVLVYGTGGYAFGSETTSLNVNPAILSYSKTNDLSGWVAGGGIEYAVTNNLSIKGEYQYLNFDGNNVFSSKFANVSNKLDMHTARVGLNYALWK